MHTVPTVDLYRELEVDPDASPQTIEAAWRSLVKRHHPDVAAERSLAAEKIKRLNLAHEWLTDRRLREMYDLTRMRRRHAEVTFRESASSTAGPGTGASHPVRRVGGPTLTPSAVVSTAVVAILVAAALGSVALNRPAQEALTAGPHASTITGAASAQPATVASLPPATAAALPALPPYEGRLPSGCIASGDARRLDTFDDGRPAALVFVPCRDGRTAGPLVHVLVGTGWASPTAGKLERAVLLDAGTGSLTGAPGEYWVAWTSGDGVESWLAIYRIDGQAIVDVWHSLAAGLPPWELASYRYLSEGGPRGSIEIISSDPGSGQCRTCPGQLYREIYEWDGATMNQSWRQPEGD